MRLLKVPTKLCINPASADKDVIDNIPMADLESDNASGMRTRTRMVSSHRNGMLRKINKEPYQIIVSEREQISESD